MPKAPKTNFQRSKVMWVPKVNVWILFVGIKEEEKQNLWFLDSGCSKHMTSDLSKFSTFTKKDGGFITFGDNAKGKIIDIGNAGNSVIFISDSKDNVYTIDVENFLLKTNVFQF